MARHSKSLGNAGETAAQAYLISVGYKIIVNNFRKSSGEIDIIAEIYHNNERLVAFVEVKTRKGYGDNPRLAVTAAKEQRIKQTALAFVSEQAQKSEDEAAVWSDTALRFDIIEIEGGTMEVLHYEDVFR